MSTILRFGASMALISALTAASTGCGGDVSNSSSSGQGSGQGGGGQGGSGQGGGASCEGVTPGTFGFDVTMEDGTEYGCGELLTEDLVQIEGVVTGASSQDVWVIDTCPPTADCMPSLVTVTVEGGAKLAIPAGVLVSVAFSFKSLGGVCSEGLLVKNLPSWYGLANPVATDEAPWFDTVGLQGSHFTLEHIEQCGMSGGGIGCPNAYYKLRFMLKEDPSITTEEVAIAETASWTVPSGPAKGSYTVRNVSSDSGYCEIPGHTLAWVSRNP